MARLGLINAELELASAVDGYDHQMLRKRMRDNPHFNAFNYLNDEEFFDTYRLSKTLASMVVHELEPHLPSIRSTSVSVVAKVLTSLGFYATGSSQRTVGQATQHSLALQTVSKCLREVTLTLNHRDITRKFIKFPQTVQERNIIKKGFYDKFQLPGVMGCVDGTHIAIIQPSVFEERYYNRKHYHSLNAQIVSDSNLNILIIDASYGIAMTPTFGSDPRQHVEDLYQ